MAKYYDITIIEDEKAKKSYRYKVDQKNFVMKGKY